MKPTVVIVDSGINTSHPALEGSALVGAASFSQDNRGQVRPGRDYDKLGHGTAVAAIVTAGNDVRVFSVKVFDDKLECSEETLIAALSYVDNCVPCDVLNISAGLTGLERRIELESICQRITDKGCCVVSAFDNGGAISYPAGFPCVIGVDASAACVRPGEIEFVEGPTINILGRGGIRRVAWLRSGYNFAGGTSMAAAEVTRLISRIVSEGVSGRGEVMRRLRSLATRVHQGAEPSVGLDEPLTVAQAALVPYNKEIQSIVRSADLLRFSIDSIFDVNISGNVGRVVSSSGDAGPWTIAGIDSIDWDGRWDTLVMGHLQPLVAVAGRDLVHELLTKCATYRKNVFSFDPISSDYKKASGLDWRWPHFDDVAIPKGRFGKMHYIGTPIIGVFGTSSQQGKFTLQVFLREYYQSRGYKVGQIGTEPSALLFGMERCFPIGFNSPVALTGAEMVVSLNEMLHKLDSDGRDLIIVGGQSGTVPYDFGNLSLYTISQLCFLMGTNPDCVVLCVNPYDDDDYLTRTVSVVEGLVDTTVVSVAMFPMGFRSEWAISLGARRRLDSTELEEECKRVSDLTGKPCVPLDEQSDYERIAQYTCDFLVANG